MIYPWFTALFEQLVKRMMVHRLHHGMLFSGPDGIGKHQLATELSHTLLCRRATINGPCGECQSCQLFEAGNHSDYYKLVSDKQLGVDKIREGIAKLNATAHIGTNKVLVIPDADTMTEAAANALLKTLEEPTDNTFIILLTAKPGRLLPTIISRCEKHTLSLPETAQSLSWLKAQGIDASPAILKAYGYAPLRVQRGLTKQEGLSFRDYQEGIERLMSNQETARSLATRWQDDAALVITWIQHEVHERYTASFAQSDYQHLLHCAKAQQHLQHAGVNKGVILAGVLDVLTGSA